MLTTASAANDTTEEMKTADLARVSSTGEETVVTAAESPAAAAVSGASRQGEVAPAATTAGATAPPQTPGTQVARRELPKTSSTLPLAAVAGWALFCSGIWMAARPRF